MAAKAIMVLIAISTFSLACDPAALFLSSRSNKRSETIAYDFFAVTIDVGGLLHGRQRYVTFVFSPTDSLLVHTKNLQIFYKGGEVAYSVNNVNDIVSISMKDQWIGYGLTPRPKERGGDTISIFGPGIFQMGDKFYDLDTLDFIMKEPYWWQ
jgi:hypothetical protein